MSNIEWTEATWNPTVGCWPVSPGCLHCYAATMTKRLAAMGQKDYAGLLNDRGDHFNGLMRELPHKLDIPLKRKKPTMYFVNSMSDLFDEQISDEFLNRVFEVMERCTQHTFQVLTKRAKRLAEYVGWRWGKREDGPGHRIPARNIWLGVSAEDQQRADDRIPWLLKTPAAVRFVSAEPLLGPVDFMGMLAFTDGLGSERGVDWVIVGGESGVGCRPCHLDWIRSIVEQCSWSDAACFVKQLGGNPRFSNDVEFFIDSKKGGDMDEWPADLRVRQYPQVAKC